MDGGAKLVKYLLFFFNLLFVVTGVAVIAVGAVVQANSSNYFDFVGRGFTSTAVLLIVVGVIIFLIAFFGCCGAIKENHCMVITFSVLIFIIFVLEFSAGIAAYAYRSKFDDILKDGMLKNLKQYDSSDAARKTWDETQKELKCCGVYNSSDYGKYNLSIPDTCCNKVVLEKTGNCTDYTQGCHDALFNKIENYQYTIGGVGVGIAIVQLTGIVLACCLGRAIKKQYEVV